MDSITSPLPIQAINIAITGGELSHLKQHFSSMLKGLQPREPFLDLAIRHGQLEIVKFLIEELPYDLHQSLRLAVREQQPKIVEFLLNKEKDARINSLPSNITFKIENTDSVMEAIPVLELIVNKGYADQNNQSLLHLAVLNRQYAMVDLLLQHGAAVNQKDDNSCTPLHYATQHQNIAVTQLLLEQEGIEVDPINNENRTPLYYAVTKEQKGNQKETVELLLKKGSKFELQKMIYRATVRGDKTIVELLINQAIDINNNSSKEEIINYVYSKEEGRVTLLHLAAIKGYEDIVELLLSKKADRSLQDREGCLALHYAVREKRIEIARKLLSDVSNASNVNYPRIKNSVENHPSTPLEEAIYMHDVEVIDVFLKERLVRDSDWFYAAQVGSPETVQHILDNHLKIDINAKSPGYRFTALHLATLTGNVKVMQFLLNRNAMVTQKDNAVPIPIHIALEDYQGHSTEKQIEIIKTLLQDSNKAVEQINYQNSMRKNILDLALQKKKKDIIKILLEYIAKYTPNANVDNALHWAASPVGDVEILKMLIDQFSFESAAITKALYQVLLNSDISSTDLVVLVESLLSKGADLQLKIENTGKTALHIAVESKNSSTQLLQLILEAVPIAMNAKGEEVPIILNVKDHEDRTPLLLAARLAKKELSNYLLLQPGIEISVLDKNQYSALHYATQHQSTTILEALLKYYEKNNQKVIDDFKINEKHPIILATSANQKEAVELLLNYFQNPDLLTHVAFWATKAGYSDLVKRVFEYGLDLKAKKSEDTILTVAAQSGNHEVIQYLLDKQYDTTVTNNQGWLPLHLAINAGHIKSAILLIQNHKGTEIHSEVEANGNTPLHLAIDSSLMKKKPQAEILEVVQLLVENNVNCNSQNYRGKTPLQLAMNNGFSEIALFLIRSSANIFSRISENQNTFLHLAVEVASSTENAEEQFLPVVKALVENNVGINSKNGQGASALNLTIANGLELTALYLIDSGADIFSRITAPRSNYSNHLVETENFSNLHLAAQSNLLGVTRVLLEKGMNANCITHNGITPTHVAAAHKGNIETLKLLTEYGAKIDNQTNKGETALYISAEIDDQEMTQYLLDEYQKQKSNGKTVKDIQHLEKEDGWTPLYIAIFNQNLPIINILLRAGIDMKLQGLSALKHAAQGKSVENNLRGKNIEVQESPISPNKYHKNFYSKMLKRENVIETEILEVLLKQYLTVQSLSPAESSDLLSIAITYNQLAIVKFLLNKPGFEANTIDSKGWYPIQRAGHTGSVEILQILLDQGAKINIITEASLTALSYAANKGHTDAINWLLSNQADPMIQDSRHKRNSLHWAVEGGFYNTVKILLQRTTAKNTRSLLLDAQDQHGETPLHLAVLIRDPQITRLLLEDGAANSIEDAEGWTPMDLALFINQPENSHTEMNTPEIHHPEIILMLFNAGAKVAKSMEKGQLFTLLKEAIIANSYPKKGNDNENMAKTLLSEFIANTIFKIQDDPATLGRKDVLKEAKNILSTLQSLVNFLQGIPPVQTERAPIDEMQQFGLGRIMLMRSPNSATDPRTRQLITSPRFAADHFKIEGNSPNAGSASSMRVQIDNSPSELPKARHG